MRLIIIISSLMWFIIHSNAFCDTSQKKNIIYRDITVSIKSTSYISYSTIKPTFPFIIGYPTYNSDAIGLDVTYSFQPKILNHNFGFNAILPAKITSDNGKGSNYLLNKDESTYNRIETRYHFFNEFWNFYDVEFLYGLSSSIMLETRYLKFKSDDVIKQSDINFGIGIALGAQRKIWKMFSANIEGHFLLFMPYTCYGRHSFENIDMADQKDSYHPITYKAIWDMSVEGKLNKAISVRSGYRRTNQIGYGNSKNSFVLNYIITSKMDRINEFFLGVTVRI